MCGERRRILARSPGGVSPVRIHAADFDLRQAKFTQRLADAGKRRLEIAPYVVRQGFQRRDVDNLRRVFEFAGQPLPDQPVDRREKGSQGFAGAGWGRDQHRPARLDRRPGRRLRRRRRGKAALEPARDRGMKQRRGCHRQQQ